MVRAKVLKMSMAIEILNGDMLGDCRRWEKIAESNVGFFRG